MRTNDPNESRCFGSTYERDLSGELTDQGYTLNLRWPGTTFLIQSCQITKQEEKQAKYIRLP